MPTFAPCHSRFPRPTGARSGVAEEGATRSRITSLLLVLLTTASIAAAAATAPNAQAKRGDLSFLTPPSARQFARLILASTASAQANSISLENVNCLRASRVDYMCSYAVTSPYSPRSCHLIQARWTPQWGPNGLSLYTVSLAGRVPVCNNLRDALHSLR
jgi:hypothetical protein